MKSVSERFIDYAKLPTMSDEANENCPSSEKQFALARLLRTELEEMGLKAILTDQCYLYAELEANCASSAVIGFIAHLDTSSEAPDENVSPARVRYDGGDILLNEQLGIYLSEKDYPQLSLYRGEELIVTDGTTLLGADDKAGVSEIMSAIEYIVENDIPHGTVKVAFTPDEEIGRGADLFDVDFFGADYAYTVDGCRVGEIEYENFNAASAVAEFSGISIHPGDAKGKMKSAILMAHDFHSRLPEKETPYYTEGYEGFFHLLHAEGACESAKLTYIIRDHDMELFLARKDLFRVIADEINEKYGEGSVKVTLKDQYYNMKEKIEPHPHIIERARSAFLSCGVTPISKPFRGGTDGAILSFKGLPCPNLSTGGENFHSRFEFVSVSSLEKMVRVLVRLVTDLTE